MDFDLSTGSPILERTPHTLRAMLVGLSLTLRQLLATWVTHDLSHVAQLARVMAKQYRDAVGPWRAYLPVMDR